MALLTHDFWQRRFAGDPGAVGGTFNVNGTEHEVIGVLPEGFALPKVDPRFGALEEAEFFAPLTVGDEYRGRSVLVLGRLASGVDLGRAQAEMTALAERLEADHDYNAGWGVNLVSLHEQVVGHLRTALQVILGAVGLLLAIACVNVANLLLARATARRRAATMTQPFDGFGIGTSFLVEGRPDPGRRDRPVADVRPVTPGYFHTLGIPLLTGRDFDERDGLETPRTAVVSEALVRMYWPEGGALGKKVLVSLGEMTPYEIVGVVGEIKHMGFDTTPRSMIYIPHAQFQIRGMTLLARSSSEVAPVAAAVRQAVADIDASTRSSPCATSDGV